MMGKMLRLIAAAASGQVVGKERKRDASQVKKKESARHRKQLMTEWSMIVTHTQGDESRRHELHLTCLM